MDSCGHCLDGWAHLRAMVEQGWVEATTIDDGRSYEARLTAEGRAKLVEAYPAWSAAQREVEALISKTQHDQLRAIARRVTAKA